jgi:Sigma 54 modulation protein / S30EA ribosomal protein
MQVLVKCDDPVCCDEELIRRVEGVIEGALERFGERLLRVEVRLRDLNSEKPGDRDKVCSLEARMAGATSVMAEHHAPTLAEAIHVSTGKLERLVERYLSEFARALAAPATPAGHSPAPR